MFSLNENNQILLFDSPVDMRLGVNRMCGHVNEQGLTPTDGRVYVFVGRTRKTMKLLHWERGGYVMYYKRLETGRFSPKLFKSEEGFRVVRWDELVLLMEGISTKAHRRKRFQITSESTEKEGKRLKILQQIFGYLAENQYLCNMKKDQETIDWKAKYEELNIDYQKKCDELQAEKERVAWLERQLFGPKSDKLKAKPVDPNWPTFFDDQFKEALAEKDKATEKAVEDIKKESEKRHNESKKKNPNRPAKYLYDGLEEHTTTLTPEGINLDDYDVIGKDVIRVLHRNPAKVWVECIVRPIYRRKGEAGKAHPDIKQAPAPRAIIGGGHAAADFISPVIDDKYHYHIPEYRQVKRLSEIGVKISTSTINEWVHEAANRLYCIYECDDSA